MASLAYCEALGKSKLEALAVRAQAHDCIADAGKGPASKPQRH